MGYFHSASSWKRSALARPRGRERAGVGRQGSSQRMQGPSPSLDKSLSIMERRMGGLGDAACLWQRCPAAQVPLGQLPQPRQGWRMLWHCRGDPHSPWTNLEVFLCRAAGLPEPCWRETLNKHSAHPTAAALEKPSSHTGIYRKFLHQSINSSPTSAAGNISPMLG